MSCCTNLACRGDGCHCGQSDFPPEPAIAAGLSALPRQLAGFPEYRLALLCDLAQHAPLADWRAREGDDPGLMLIEMWAYVLDILSFYDERLADESYLRTARRRPSLRKLVGLLGYRPRPALASAAVLAVIAEGGQPTSAPPGTALRSEAFGGEAPQVFESSAAAILDAKRNRFTVAPVRPTLPGDELLLEAPSAGLVPGQLVLFSWRVSAQSNWLTLLYLALAAQVAQQPKSDGSPYMVPGLTLGTFQLLVFDHLVMMAAGRVRNTEAIEALDGETYVRLDVAPTPKLDPGVELAQVEVLAPSLSARPRRFGEALAPDAALGGTRVLLDNLYPQLNAGALVILELAGELRSAQLVLVETVTEEILPPGGEGERVPTGPLTRVSLRPELPASWMAGGDRLVIHFNLVDSGRLTRVAETRLGLAELDGARLAGRWQPLDKIPAELLLQDADGQGVHVQGTVAVDAVGDATLKVDKVANSPDAKQLPRPLRAPVEVFANLLPVSRGESVTEVLGSGDASLAFQSFALTRKPLTYLSDPTAPDGRRATLAVRVAGILWREVASFFAAGPEDQVYVLRQDDAEVSTVTFGDGVRGARLPSGVANVSATYRFGGGAAKPPAGTINQVARPVKGLRRVIHPLAAGGGADADSPADLRHSAPASALTLGRAISLADFEALAMEYGGVIQARADWAWHETSQRAVVKVGFITDGGDIGPGLTAFLRGQADPATPVVASAAQALPTRLVLDLEVDPGYLSQEVENAVAAALADAESGLLAPANVPLGGPLFRSALFAAVHAVAGVVSARAVTVDGGHAPLAINTPEGHYRNYLPDLMVGSTAAGDELFAAAQASGSANLVAFNLAFKAEVAKPAPQPLAFLDQAALDQAALNLEAG